MKILMLHNLYRERGGEDLSFFAEVQMLREAGITCLSHQVDNRNVGHFGLTQAINTVWAHGKAREIAKLIRDEGIDIVHIHNFFPQISPAVHWAARRGGAAIVQTLHNYRLACLNGLFFRGGQVCEDCLGRTPIRGIIHRCYRGSVTASGVVAAMLMTHRALGTWVRCVDRFITVSSFARQKMIEAGVPGEKISVKPNFLERPPAASGPGGGGYFIYVGRLSHEKGIATLLAAWQMLTPPAPRLKIVGTGPLDSFVQAAAQAKSRIDFLGLKSREEVLALIGSAEALILPSICYETFGRVAMEAYAVGTPVIGADIGAVSEIVEEGITGFRFRAGSAAALAKKVSQIVAEPERLRSMRSAARYAFERRYTVGRNLEILLDIYRQASAHAAAQKQHPLPTL